MTAKAKRPLAEQPTACPVEAIARRQSDLWAAYDANTNGPEEAKGEGLLGSLQEALDTNFMAASWVYPTSPIGALFQTVNAMEAIGDLIENEVPEEDAKKMLQRVRRCLYGVVRVLEQTAHMPRATLHMEWASGDQCDEILALHRATLKEEGAP